MPQRIDGSDRAADDQRRAHRHHHDAAGHAVIDLRGVARRRGQIWVNRGAERSDIGRNESRNLVQLAGASHHPADKTLDSPAGV